MDAPATDHSSVFGALSFRFPFRKYQQMALDVVAHQAGRDHKYHLVAPPGSGKTIVGLELIRRFGCPSVVFAPTTTIQKQWQEKVSMFTPDPEWVGRHTSLDTSCLRELNFFTYQSLSTPGENLAFVEQVAVERWIDDLRSSGRVQTQEEAQQRIDTLREANRVAFRREVAKRYRRIKRDLLRENAVDGRRLLHANAQALIDRIVSLGTGTLVLDECHHLLDYWAFILRELIRALPEVRVIGLTATLPDLVNEVGYENYSDLLGDVDFEVPTPAVIKEGNLAPFRDLVYFCQPSRREMAYLNEIQGHFEAAVERITETEPFWDWVRRLVIRPANSDCVTEPFTDFYLREPDLALAATKYLLTRDQLLPADIPLMDEMLETLSMDDWLTLLEAFGLEVLKTSADPAHQALFYQLKEALTPFGISITESGIRHQRSVGDLLLALSESKDRAVATILRAELGELGEQLRAVVITDFERLSVRARRLKGVLDADAGSAVRVFHHLIADPETNTLDPVLVTGKVVLVDADNRVAIEAEVQRWAREYHAAISWDWRPTPSPWVMELAGGGRDWSPRVYVGLITGLFERGVTRCLVGTRGIFGEGWDALSLNTLIDLTSVTTRTGVQQIRGRGLRLDPNQPKKVTHNWDVVCVSPDFEKGEADLRRFVARHAHSWGVITGHTDGHAEKMGAPRMGRRVAGRIVRGVAHVDPDLAREWETESFGKLRLDRYTRRSLAAVSQRDLVRQAWRVGEGYENAATSAIEIHQPQAVRFRTVQTVERSLKGVTGRLVLVAAAVAVPAWYATATLSGAGLGAPQVLLLGLLGGAAGLVAAVNGRSALRIFRGSLVEQPAADGLQDMGSALLAALKAAGLASTDLGAADVRIIETESGGYEVYLDKASVEDVDTFCKSFTELLGPLDGARYLVERDGTRLRVLSLRPVWFLLRRILPTDMNIRAYHRVPSVLASHRGRAEVFAGFWRQYVGGGRLVFARTAAGRQALVNSGLARKGHVPHLAFEYWR